MINTVNTRGLVVEEISPSPSSTVNNPKAVNIKFNSDLIKLNTISSNLCLLEDVNMIYSETGENNLNDCENYIPVKYSLTYKDRVLTLNIKDTKPNTRYIIKIKGNNIEDALGNILPEFTSSFFTSSEIEQLPCEIIAPANGSVMDHLGEVQFQYIDGDTCLIQISKHKNFETLKYEKSFNVPNDIGVFSVNPNIFLEHGSYYLRVRTPRTAWSRSVQIIFDKSSVNNSTVAGQDAKDVVDILNQLGVPDREILEVYPVNKNNVSEKQNIFGIKVSGKVDVDEVDLNNTYIVESLFDEKDYKDEEDETKEIGDMTISTYFSDEEDATYIILSINKDEVIEDITIKDASTDTQEDLREREKMEEIAREELGIPNIVSEGTITNGVTTSDFGTDTVNVNTADSSTETASVSTSSVGTETT